MFSIYTHVKPKVYSYSHDGNDETNTSEKESDE